MLTVSERQAFDNSMGKFVEYGYTHNELHLFLINLKAGDCGWIETKISQYGTHAFRFEVEEDGKPFFLDYKCSQGDVNFFISQYGSDAAELLLHRHTVHASGNRTYVHQPLAA